jgi:hypothetical protein
MGERTRTATGGEHGGDHDNVAVLDHRPGRQGWESGVGGGDATLERDPYQDEGGEG